ncbi:MAG TPA: DnaJ domain-containing protein [Pyrinomonadaceae bacterium]|nr:DnaJ domain-containing protein [Pyrinomonadaceae bacterium]
MNGQLSEQPLVELIREISSKSLGGRLRLEHERVKVVAYFDNGNCIYAASNLRTLRLRDSLLKNNLISDQDLRQFNDRVSDFDLVKVLCAQNLLTPSAAGQVQTKLVSDILRLALLWTEGTWDFDSRSRLNEQLNLNIDAGSLLLEAGRRLPPKFAASRFRNPGELITPLTERTIHENLLPAEGFLLSRLDRPMILKDLVAVSGMGETETLGIVYSLALGGLVIRERWESAFRDSQPGPQPSPQPEPEKEVPKPEQPEADPNDVENFLARVKKAQTHYDVLGVTFNEQAQNLKNAYYQLARRYHPDRFRKSDASLLARIESAFARITQAYDTLRDDNVRATYNSKLAARKKAEQLAESAPKATTTAPQPEPVTEGVAEPVIPLAERAEIQFKEGFAALELGQKKAAIRLFASAARAVPNEARYRAFYGHMLAGNEDTRRAAETELQAAIKLDPNNAEYRVMLAELYRDLGLKLRAKGEAERAIATDPNNRKARDLLRALQ